MQRLMLRMDALVSRRRRWVLVAWVLILAAAVPFAARQSEGLSSGGFGVPGSQSARVAEALPGSSLGIVLTQPHEVSALIHRATAVDHVVAAGNRVTEGGVTVIPLRLDVPDDEATDVAIDLRDGARSRRERGVPDRAGGAVGRAPGRLQARPRAGRADGLPDRPADPARRLRFPGRGGAAAGARLLLRAGHGRPDLLHLAGDGHVGLRDQHGVDDRDRRRGRLLAVRAGPLPRGDRGWLRTG